MMTSNHIMKGWAHPPNTTTNYTTTTTNSHTTNTTKNNTTTLHYTTAAVVIVFVLIIMAAAAPADAAAATSPLPPDAPLRSLIRSLNPYAYWPLTTSWDDIVPSSNAPMTVHATALPVPSLVNQGTHAASASFAAGKGTAFSPTAIVPSSASGFAVSLWVLVKSNQEVGTVNVIQTPVIGMFVKDTNTAVFAYWYDVNRFEVDWTPYVDRWTFVALTYDFTNQTPTMHINGKDMSALTSPTKLSDNTHQKNVPRPPYNGGVAHRLGWRDGYNSFHGSLAHVAVCPSAQNISNTTIQNQIMSLSPLQHVKPTTFFSSFDPNALRAAMDQQKPTYRHWLDNAVGLINAPHQTGLTLLHSQSKAGPNGAGGMRFPTKAAGLRTAVAPTLLPADATGMTMEMWLWSPDPNTLSGGFVSAADLNEHSFMVFKPAHVPGHMRIRFNDDRSSSPNYEKVDIDFSKYSGRHVHLVMTHNFTSQEAIVYLNGKAVWTGLLQRTAPLPLQRHVYFGHHPFLVEALPGGEISHFAFYDQVHTAADIAHRHHLRTVGPVCPADLRYPNATHPVRAALYEVHRSNDVATGDVTITIDTKANADSRLFVYEGGSNGELPFTLPATIYDLYGNNPALASVDAATLWRHYAQLTPTDGPSCTYSFVKKKVDLAQCEQLTSTDPAVASEHVCKYYVVSALPSTPHTEKLASINTQRIDVIIKRYKKDPQPSGLIVNPVCDTFFAPSPKIHCVVLGNAMPIAGVAVGPNAALFVANGSCNVLAARDKTYGLSQFQCDLLRGLPKGLKYGDVVITYDPAVLAQLLRCSHARPGSCNGPVSATFSIDYAESAKRYHLLDVISVYAECGETPELFTPIDEMELVFFPHQTSGTVSITWIRLTNTHTGFYVELRPNHNDPSLFNFTCDAYANHQLKCRLRPGAGFYDGRFIDLYTGNAILLLSFNGTWTSGNPDYSSSAVQINEHKAFQVLASDQEEESKTRIHKVGKLRIVTGEEETSLPPVTTTSSPSPTPGPTTTEASTPRPSSTSSPAPPPPSSSSPTPPPHTSTSAPLPYVKPTATMPSGNVSLTTPPQPTLSTNQTNQTNGEGKNDSKDDDDDDSSITSDTKVMMIGIAVVAIFVFIIGVLVVIIIKKNSKQDRAGEDEEGEDDDKEEKNHDTENAAATGGEPFEEDDTFQVSSVQPTDNEG